MLKKKKNEDEKEINLEYEEQNNNNSNNINNNYKKTVIQNEKRVKDYQINGNDKSSEEINKRKPFDKIIFK